MIMQSMLHSVQHPLPPPPHKSGATHKIWEEGGGRENHPKASARVDRKPGADVWGAYGPPRRHASILQRVTQTNLLQRIGLARRLPLTKFVWGLFSQENSRMVEMEVAGLSFLHSPGSG